MSDRDDSTDEASAAAHRGAEEPTVKQLLEDPAAHSDTLDAATLAELQRWFGLPSAMDLPAEEPSRTEHERKVEAALAAVEPGFLQYVQRLSGRLVAMFEEASLRLMLDEHYLTVSERFQSLGKLGEPREVEIPYQLEDDLKERVPQALLRDLHRTEESFPKYLEITPLGEPIPDVRLHVAAAIARGEAERAVVSPREELARACAERVEARQLVPWETLSRAVQSEARSDAEREP